MADNSLLKRKIRRGGLHCDDKRETSLNRNCYQITAYQNPLQQYLNHARSRLKYPQIYKSRHTCLQTRSKY